MRRTALATSLVALALSSACAPTTTPPKTIPAAKPAGAEALRDEAKRLAPVTSSALGQHFLAATAELPHVAPRTLFADSSKAHYFTAREAAALSPAERSALKSIEIDEESYYETKYGSPLSYVRPLDVLAAHGLTLAKGDRVLDFGYGYVGHLRLLATLGFRVTGVDVDPMLRALYSEPGDSGNAGGGSVTLLNGPFPKDPKIVEAVGTGYALVISKNVLKRGYIHPDRPADPKHLIDLGMTDDAVLAAFFATLRPGGTMLIYNICPALSPPDKPFVPWSDGRSPFTREAWTAAGFVVLELDRDDIPAVQQMARLLGWDKDPDDPWDVEHDISVLYTLVKRPG
jgi:hypothetical protein